MKMEGEGLWRIVKYFYSRGRFSNDKRNLFLCIYGKIDFLNTYRKSFIFQEIYRSCIESITYSMLTEKVGMRVEYYT